MGLSSQELTSILAAFEELGLSELILDVGGTHVELASNGKPPLGRTATPNGSDRSTLHDVLAPSVGIVRLQAEPGLQVRADDVVCALDVWTSTIPVQAGIDGTVREVHVAEGTMVEYGQPLFGIEGS
ncbi:MAG: acetyl-CoA carboxylase biotin carboxyl carrier protein [Gaiellaceae bacterium]|jgi:biotin carboxyl carrier protein|nr:acetyl-CoA carboxylase biotin carboxyl carrier protein [Gaiellaceae bacterium]MDX6474098.1 acetyl-CoA carboxylase biotin carboxyl carrier protein [Gaiellaceae bacterium]